MLTTIQVRVFTVPLQLCRTLLRLLPINSSIATTSGYHTLAPRPPFYLSLLAPVPSLTLPPAASLLSSAAQIANIAPTPVIAVRTRCSFVHRSINCFVLKSCAAFASSSHPPGILLRDDLVLDVSFRVCVCARSKSLSLVGLRNARVKGMMEGRRMVAARLRRKGWEERSCAWGLISRCYHDCARGNLGKGRRVR